ncbi:MAG: hypothetical protein WCA46_00050, partial [Actinocatenispora sp.]
MTLGDRIGRTTSHSHRPDETPVPAAAGAAPSDPDDRDAREPDTGAWQDAAEDAGPELPSFGPRPPRAH